MQVVKPNKLAPQCHGIGDLAELAEWWKWRNAGIFVCTLNQILTYRHVN